MKIALIATSVALTLGSGVALAQAVPERGAAVTKQTVADRAAARFDRRDANSDGVLNDADRSARADRVFARMDANSDGAISRAEWDAMRATRGDRREARMEHRGKRGGDRMARRMQRLDIDGDGTLTRAEAVAAATSRFDRLDANRDGTLTREERQAARAARRTAR